MRGRRLFVAVSVGLMALCGAERALAQDPQSKPEKAKATAGTAEEPPGTLLADTDRLRLSISFLAGYGHDAAHADKGFEKQGQVGYAIVTLAGRLGARMSYLLSINPVNELSPLPACREAGFFRPNDPLFLYADLYAQGRGPEIACNPQGTRRVDMYREISLDMLPQQGMLREGYVRFQLPGRVYMQLGRMAAQFGFTPEEAGSWTAKDATLIQRLNRDAYFTLRVGSHVKVRGVEIIGSASAIVGDSDAGKDYGYNKLFANGSLDGNSGPGFIGEVAVRHPKFDVRVAYRHNEMGSKVESLSPSYWAAGKHNDDAVVASAQYRISRYNRVLAECGRYTVGLRPSSANMVGSSPEPVEKQGCYFAADGGFAIRPGFVIVAGVAREEIDRADSLIRYLSEQGLHGVTEGKHDRMSVFRVSFELNRQVMIGYYFNRISNPYPWASGIWPTEGSSAFSGRSLNRWGVVLSFWMPRSKPISR